MRKIVLCGCGPAHDVMRKIRLLGEAEAIIANRRRKLMETDFTKRVSEKG